MTLARLAIVFACCLSLVYSQAVLTFCLPAGSYYRCQGVFNYTGPFQGESIEGVSFSAPDGEYVPVNPLSIVASLKQATLAQSVGDDPSGMDYPLGTMVASGSCNPNATSSALFDSCMNYLVNTSSTLTLASRTDLCGSTGSAYYTWICAVNNLRGAVGISPRYMGKIFVADTSAHPTYIGNITSNVDGSVETLITDLSVKSDTARQVWVQGITFPAVDSSVIPLWIKNGSSVLVPGEKYFKSKRSFLIERNWASNIGTTLTAGDKFQSVANISVGSSSLTTQLIAENVAFCKNVGFTCNKDFSMTTYSSGVITTEFLQPLSGSMAISNDTTKSYIISSQSVGNITATIGFSMLLKRLPPKITILGMQAFSEEKLVLVKCLNQGNAGTIPVRVSYVQDNIKIPDMVMSHSASAGEFTISIESGRVAKVCIGVLFDDCIHITYGSQLGGALPGATQLPNVGVVSTAFTWFDAASGYLYIFQIAFFVLAGLLVLGVVIYIAIRIRRRGQKTGGLANRKKRTA